MARQTRGPDVNLFAKWAPFHWPCGLGGGQDHPAGMLISASRAVEQLPRLSRPPCSYIVRADLTACGQTRAATAWSRPSATYQTWGLPKNRNARHRGTRTKCPIVCDVVIDSQGGRPFATHCNGPPANCRAAWAACGVLEQEKRANDICKPGKPSQENRGLRGPQRHIFWTKQGRTLLPAWPLPSLVSSHHSHERRFDTARA